MKFEPTEDGIYTVNTNGATDPSPYKEDDFDEHYFFIVKMVGDVAMIWRNDQGDYQPWSSFDIFLKCRYPGDEVLSWKKQNAHRPCFKCRKPIFPSFEPEDFKSEESESGYVFHGLGCADLRTDGHFGSTFIDDMGKAQISVLICDYCLRKYGDAVVWYDIPVNGPNYNYRTELDNQNRSREYNREVIRLMEEGGFEWRNYTREFQIAQHTRDIDVNYSGWYPKDWKPSYKVTVFKDGSRGLSEDARARHTWQSLYPDLFDKIDDLRLKIYHPNDSRDFLAKEAKEDYLRRMNCKTEEELRAFNDDFLVNLRKTVDDAIDQEATKKANEQT